MLTRAQAARQVILKESYTIHSEVPHSRRVFIFCV
jgi:hypothetical protein